MTAKYTILQAEISRAVAAAESASVHMDQQRAEFTAEVGRLESIRVVLVAGVYLTFCLNSTLTRSLSLAIPQILNCSILM